MAAGVRKVLQTANRVNNTLLPQFESLKQHRLGKSAYNIYVDYKNVFVDFLKGIKKRPLKSMVQFGLVGVGYLVYRHNPDENTYYDTVMENNLALLQISNSIRSPESDSYTQSIQKLYNQGRLQRQSFGIFSLMLLKDYGKEYDGYEKHCYYTKTRWVYLWKQVIDIGVLGHWYYLEKSMNDFDINYEELKDCPDDVEEGNVWVKKVSKMSLNLKDFVGDLLFCMKQSMTSSET
ncbi:mitochondrial import inner membrane translocase subunit Tim29-like [Actinia tenebrosa]|uniref:Mitochondrial import inner membrane translocase subunit Tim29-like n=1 Tax=Actinia tenebrosa TaxID=6105 RepID=A0A6P8HBJ8_ACTTE|nr:mitochondrial import inner membrane translocase subunit Tim29-like [Actinia tenebrosa]